MDRAPPRATVWLFAIAVIAPVALVLWAHRVPPEWEARQDVIHLAGEWRMLDVPAGSPGDFQAPEFDDSSWPRVQLPGRLATQNRHLWLRKRVDLPAPLRGHDLFLVLGDVRGAPANVYAQGRLVGRKGEATRELAGASAAIDGWTIPARATTTGQVEVAIELFPDLRAGITDNRILLGRHELLAPWHFQLVSVLSFLELGTLLVLLGLGAAVSIIWRLQGPRADKALYRSTLLLVGTATLYLVGKSAFLVSALLPRDAVSALGAWAVFLIALVIPEYAETQFLHRTTRFRRANRVVMVAFMVSIVVFSLTNQFALAALSSQLYIPYLFGIIIYTCVLAVRDVVRRGSVFSPLIAAAILLLAATGINDLLGDLNLLFTPRLFTVGIANLAVVCAVVVVGEFLGIAEENVKLSASLTIRNDELADALVKAQESSRVKSEFLANTSHELRTPLNSIINIPQGLLERFQEVGQLDQVACSNCHAVFSLERDEQPGTTCPECGQPTLGPHQHLATNIDAGETARLLGSVVHNGQHLLSVVNDILDYSKLEAGRVVLHPEPVRAQELLDEVRLTVEPVAAHADVKLVVEAAPDVSLEADRVKLTQVLINLVSNAIKFSDGKGTVTVRSALAGRGLIISVRDEGIGIAPEHHQLIFEGFRQVEGTNTRRFGGTGLGLAISKNIVAKHGGEIRVESAVGHGSTFSVELPLMQKHEAPLPSGARTIVVVDDEGSALDTTAVALKPLGCRVVGIRDPREAVDRIRAEHPALVVLDVMMPRVSGVEVLRQLRGDPELAKIPVLVSSAYPDNRGAVEALGATFIAKPWRPGELLRVASRLTSGDQDPAEPPRASLTALERR